MENAHGAEEQGRQTDEAQERGSGVRGAFVLSDDLERIADDADGAEGLQEEPTEETARAVLEEAVDDGDLQGEEHGKLGDR